MSTSAAAAVRRGLHLSPRSRGPTLSPRRTSLEPLRTQREKVSRVQREIISCAQGPRGTGREPNKARVGARAGAGAGAGARVGARVGAGSGAGAVSWCREFPVEASLGQSVARHSKGGSVGRTSRRLPGPVAPGTRAQAQSLAHSDSGTGQSDSDAGYSDSMGGSAPALVFTTEACRFCRAAKSLLQAQGVAFQEASVGVGQPGAGELRAELAAATGIKTVPVVFVAGRLIGGAQALEEAQKSGELSRLLSSPPEALPAPILALLANAEARRSKGTGGASAGDGSTTTASAGSPWGGLSPEEAEWVLAVYRGMVDPSGGIPRADQWVREGGLLGALFPSWEPRVFNGADGVAWMLGNVPELAGKGPEAAVAVGRSLELLGLLHHAECSQRFSADPGALFRLLGDEAPLSGSLNARTPFLRPPRPAAQVAGEMRAKTLALFDQGLSLDGRSVDYTGLKGSQVYQEYVALAEELQKVDVLALSRAGQKAFWLNVYNALIVHGFIAGGPPPSLPQRLAFYAGTRYTVGIPSCEFSLDDIEHGVLRANSPGAGGGVLARPRFGARDPRRYYALPPLDPRIHFALNCGAKSCPPVRLYSEESLDEELDTAAAAFLSEEVEVFEDGSVEATKLLQWYGGDFGRDDRERLQWIVRYLDGPQKALAERVLRSGGEVKFKFKEYNWDVNGK